uniref:Uncharacterized protein n=1 Tax=Anguilla anguilla TaxID=7936 RepID=A0A0E9UR00_ANGAN
MSVLCLCLVLLIRQASLCLALQVDWALN